MHAAVTIKNPANTALGVKSNVLRVFDPVSYADISQQKPAEVLEGVVPEGGGRLVGVHPGEDSVAEGEVHREGLGEGLEELVVAPEVVHLIVVHPEAVVAVATENFTLLSSFVLCKCS